jgi:hypothetical protein
VPHSNLPKLERDCIKRQDLFLFNIGYRFIVFGVRVNERVESIIFWQIPALNRRLHRIVFFRMCCKAGECRAGVILHPVLLTASEFNEPRL